jgi:hypothetical protein
MNPIEKARVEFRDSGKNLTLTKAGVITWTVTALLLLSSQLGCKPGKTKIDGVKYFGGPVSVLKYVRREWLKDPQSTSFQPNKLVEGSSSNVFFYTNAVQAEGKVYQCRFAVRDQVWPPGLLAICDDETVIWIQEGSGQVVVDPEHKTITL